MPLDPWGDISLSATSIQFAGVGDDASQPDAVRFARGVCKLLSRRWQAANRTDNERSVFLMARKPPQCVEAEARFVPMLDNGQTEVAGSLWFVGPVVASGHGIGLGDMTDAQLFETVSRTLELGSIPCVIYDPIANPSVVRFYLKGLAEPDEYLGIRVSSHPISITEILEVVDGVHKKQLVTPDGQAQAGKLWKDPRRCWPHSDAEHRVQHYLTTALYASFPSCKVEVEHSDLSGRSDLELVEHSSTEVGVLIRHALLELKILRSFGSGGATVSETETESWVSKGLNQAYTYRQERRSRSSALCCFDMRSGSSLSDCFGHVRASAAQLEVTLRAWRLFPTAQLYREHCVAAALADSKSSDERAG